MKQALIYLRVSTVAQANTDYDVEGYSIPAQREACLRKAEDLKADVVEEFVDRGESARSAERPALQALLRRLETNPDVDYVIVHKVDRLARSRIDDVAITLALKKAGVTLVSTTENIDETPSGKLLHGIMATIAEFYSQNLATEAKKGMRQKAKSGGTPYLAPIGYLNCREMIDGREVRTVVIDEERASFVKWAFTAYATGEWSILDLHAELADRGLRKPATARRPARPLARSNVAKMLANRYYIGVVTWEGVDYPGRHEPLIDEDVFEAVQAILRSRRESGEKVRQHQHYLKGTLWCGHCGSRMGFTQAHGNGGTYDYFFCIGRTRRNGCRQTYTAASSVEKAVEQLYGSISLNAGAAAELRELVVDHIDQAKALGQREAKVQRQLLVDLDVKRRRLLDAHYAEAIPLDLFREEQERFRREEKTARRLLEAASYQFDHAVEVVNSILEQLTECAWGYKVGNDLTRRLTNQAFFEKLYLVDDRISGADLRQPIRDLLASDLAQRLEDESELLKAPETALLYRRQHVMGHRERPHGSLPWESKQSVFRSLGSNETVLVVPTGFEPAFPA
ncbi:recombinase family protein [soil metagenome]